MLDKLQELHAQLRKAKYHYYNMHESIMTDYEFDIMEKEYFKLIKESGMDNKYTLENVVGFDVMTPMDLRHFYKEVEGKITIVEI